MKKYLCLLVVLIMTCTCVYANGELSVTAVWQDPSNIVLLWQNETSPPYDILRSDEFDGEYSLIGTSSNTSFRDDSVKYPDTYYYKIKKGDYISEPIKAVVDASQVTSVSVIMYHNFVTDEDVENGVDFDEYSIKPQDFEEDLLWLKNNGYVTITSDDLIKHLKGEKSLPHKAVILSIDDGSFGVYKNAWQILKKYNMKADFNVIGRQIDDTWENLHKGGSRDGESAPYCTWEELVEMSESGEINVCSHTYGLHVYNKNKRVGMSMMKNESPQDFAKVVEKDYRLAVSCIEGWIGKKPETVAYPYSKRSTESDKLVLENTGYKILMAGEGARGTAGNYFVKGCDFSNHITLMSRPCRMEGTPIGVYLKRIEEKDSKNGVNVNENPLYVEDTDEIATDYQMFGDVKSDDWFAGSVYYSYLNGLMRGVSYTEFAPKSNINRAMAATLLHRLAGTPSTTTDINFSDATGSEWWYQSAVWAEENGILSSDFGKFNPNDTISREELAKAMYNCGSYLKFDMSKTADLDRFSDAEKISSDYKEAVSWAVANRIFNGNADGTFNPSGKVTRAEMTMVLRNWLINTNGQEK